MCRYAQAFSLVLLSFPLRVVGIFDLLEDYNLVDWNDLFGSFFDLFFGKRKLICAVKAISLLLTTNDPTFFSDKFRDNSIMVLSEAGEYIGRDDIAEYWAFAYAETSPYLDAGPIEQAEQYRVIGYDGETGQCELHRYNVGAYMFNPVLTESTTFASISVLNSFFIDYQDMYLTRINIYYPKAFLNWYFGVQFNTQTIKEFVCNDVLDESCGETNTAACRFLLDRLPAATGDTYVDGNSLGCRVLHSAFALSNPEAHCPHVTLDLTDADNDGFVKCSSSSGITPLDLFSSETIDNFNVWIEERGLDPEVGYKELDSLPSEQSGILPF